MELVVTFKDTAKNSNFTYTPTESRLKMGWLDNTLVDENLLIFCEDVQKFLENRKYSIALRGTIGRLKDKYTITLKTAHNKKKLAFKFVGYESSLLTEEDILKDFWKE